MRRLRRRATTTAGDREKHLIIIHMNIARRQLVAAC